MHTCPRCTSPELLQELRRISHELKNALTPVLANAQLAKAVLGPDSEVVDELEDVVAGAKRANGLIAEIRALAISLGGDTE